MSARPAKAATSHLKVNVKRAMNFKTTKKMLGVVFRFEAQASRLQVVLALGGGWGWRQQTIASTEIEQRQRLTSFWPRKG